MSATNIWTHQWDADDDWSRGGAQEAWLPRGDQLGATVYALGPGDVVVYHVHHAQEELLIVLCGCPTLRTSEGERELAEGDAAHFPVGPRGAHGLRNASTGIVRYLMVSTQTLPEVVEYPDLGQVTARASTPCHTGEPLWLIHDVTSSSAGQTS